MLNNRIPVEWSMACGASAHSTALAEKPHTLGIHRCSLYRLLDILGIRKQQDNGDNPRAG